MTPDKLGTWLFRQSLRLLPGPLRERAGAEMEEIFRERSGRARGVLRTLGAWGVELGGVLLTAVRARFEWNRNSTTRGSFMDTLAQDVRFALRGIARRPLTAFLAVLTLGLGVATSTAMYSVVDAVLLRPLPYPEPERVVSVYTTNPSIQGHPTLGGLALRGVFSYPEFADLRDNVGGVLSGVAILSYGDGVLQPDDGPAERVPMMRTSASLFNEVLRVRPLMGRTFTDEDERTGFAGALLTEEFWTRRFGADPAILGEMVDIGGRLQILGVLPASFAVQGREADAWVLMPPNENRANHGFSVVGRLAPGFTAETATAALTQAFQAAVPEEQGHERHGINVFPRHDEETRHARGPLALLVAASAILLLVACGNVAVLLLGAALDREHELTVRGALGAGRGRLARQLFTESLVLAGAAAFVGVALTHAALRGLVLLAPPEVPRITEAAVNGGAMAFAVLVALACGVLFGLVPALVFSRTEGHGVLSATRGSTRRGRARLQGLVVVGELTMACVLLVGAGLLGRTVRALVDADMGFAADELLQLDLSIPFQRITAATETDEERAAVASSYYDRITGEIASLPGVRGVATTSNPPLTGYRGNNDIFPEGYGGGGILAERRFVSWNFFDVTGARIVEGRAFEELDDRADAPGAMILSRGVAELAWPGESALGKTVEYWGRPTTVVGVVENVRDEGVRQGTDVAFYIPRNQIGWLSGQYLVRVEGDPSALVQAVRERVWGVDRRIAIPVIQPLTRNRDEDIAAERYRARLVGVFSALAALFAVLGIYGVTARSVAGRTRELGVRMALGAGGESVLALVLRQGLRLAIWGALAGIALSFALTRFIEGYLWGVERTDFATLVATALALAIASLLAALAPGIRAARVDPLEALRAE